MRQSHSAFEKKIRVRPLRLADHAAVVDMQRLCFPKLDPTTREQFESQLRVFPEGQICVDHGGVPIAVDSAAKQVQQLATPSHRRCSWLISHRSQQDVHPFFARKGCPCLAKFWKSGSSVGIAAPAMAPMMNWPSAPIFQLLER